MSFLLLFVSVGIEPEARAARENPVDFQRSERVRADRMGRCGRQTCLSGKAARSPYALLCYTILQFFPIVLLSFPLYGFQ